MPADRTGERQQTDITLAGGIKVRVESLLEPGPAVSMTVTPMASVPVYLRRGGTMRRTEITLDSGARYWTLSPSEYRVSLSTDDRRRLAFRTRMDDDRAPIWLVFSDSGDPGVQIHAGYLSGSGGGSWYAYNTSGQRLRPAAQRAEQALLTLAFNYEGIFIEPLRPR